jgi:hypothetical protein
VNEAYWDGALDSKTKRHGDAIALGAASKLHSQSIAEYGPGARRTPGKSFFPFLDTISGGDQMRADVSQVPWRIHF